MKRSTVKIFLAAIAVAMLGTDCGEKSGKPQSVPPHQARTAADPLTVALAFSPGTSRTEIEIRQYQDQIRAGRQAELALERLGWLYIARARETFDAGFYKLAEQCALALARGSDASSQTSAGDAESVAATRSAGMLLRAHALQNLHQFAAAEAIARELVSARGLAADYGVLGDALMEQGRLEEAVVAYQQMADLKPDSRAATRAAHLRWLKGDVTGAIEMMQLAAGAMDARDTVNAAWVFTRLAALKWQAAGERSLLDARPHPGPLPQGEGESRAAPSKFLSRSLPNRQTQISERPTAVPSPGGEGQGEGGCSHTLPDFAEAGQDLQTALALLPNYAPALLLRGKMLLAENQLSEAIEAITLAEKQNPLPEYQWALADALEATGRSAEARVVEARLRRTGASTDPRSFALFLATRGEQPTLTLRLAREELTARADVFTHDANAWAQFAAGDVAAAQQSMKRALAEGTEDPRLFLHMATIAVRAGQTSVAENYLHKASALSHLLLPSERKQLSAVAARLNLTPAIATAEVGREAAAAEAKSF